MGEVDSKNYQGIDRRTNGARLKLSIRDWIAISSLVVTLILFGGNIKWNGEANAKQISRNTAIVDKHETQIAVLDTRLKNIEDNVSWLVIKLGKK